MNKNICLNRKKNIVRTISLTLAGRIFHFHFIVSKKKQLTQQTIHFFSRIVTETQSILNSKTKIYNHGRV